MAKKKAPSPPVPTPSLTLWPFAAPQIQPMEQLNYAMLQNRSAIFERFLLPRIPGRNERVEHVTVRVELYLAEPSPCTWEQTFDVEADEEKELHPEVGLPLVSNLQRSLHSSLLTNLKVRIEYEGKCIYLKTFPIELLAIDEWRDDDQSRFWLPSFVMPGERAVPKVIDGAQRYLSALFDDSQALFDGYQQLDPTEDRRANSGDWKTPLSTNAVDTQARAIWSTLWLDESLHYINELPTVSTKSQRVRSPSRVIEERRGTCIDLALLYAACLEYIGIYPVIFLLRGHALTGYWRSPSARERFILGIGPWSNEWSTPDPTGLPTTIMGGTSSRVRLAIWEFDQTFLPRIRAMIMFGALVPVETTKLTSPGTSFRKAIESGANRIIGTNETYWNTDFESMMDVQLARSEQVNPLPTTKEFGA